MDGGGTSRSRSSHRRTELWLFANLVTLAALFAIVGLVDVPHAAIIRGLLLIVTAAIILIVLAAVPPIAPDLENALGLPRPKSPSLDEIQRSEREVRNRYNVQEIGHFMQLLTGLHLYLQRVNESAEIRDQYIQFRTDLTFRLDDPPSFEAPSFSKGGDKELDPPEYPRQRPSLLVPLIVTKRGTLFDGLRVADGEGISVPTLSQRETRGLLVVTVRTLFAMAVREARIKQKNHDLYSMSADDLRIMWSLIRYVVCHGEKLNSQYRQVISQNLAQIDHLSEDISQKWKDRIRNFCARFSEAYVIVAAPSRPLGHELLINYMHDLPIERPPDDRTGRTRAYFGLRPHSIDVLLTRVLQADSYHFQVRAPTGQYVFDHRVGKAGSDKWLTQDDFKIGQDQQYARTHYEAGRPTAHLYVRRQGDALPDQEFGVKSRVDFREIPPGALGLAAILSTVAAAIQMFIAVTRPGLSPADIHGNADVTAFLVAAPAFVGVTMGGWANVGSAVGSSLSTYFGLMLTMVLSLTFALGYAWASDGGHDPVFEVGILYGHANLTLSYLFAPIALLSTCLAAYLAHKTFHEITYYLSLPRKVH